MLKKTTFLFLFLTVSFIAFSQNKTIDSLRNVLKKSTTDSSKANALFDLGTEFYYHNTDSAILYLKKAIDFAAKEQNKPLISDCYNNIAICYDVVGDKKKAHEYYNKILSIQKELKDTGAITAALINISVIQSDIGQNIQAINSLERAYELAKPTKDSVSICIVTANLGLIFFDLNENEKAIKYFQQALELSRATNDTYTVAVILSVLGEINMGQENYTKALEYLESAMPIVEDEGIPIVKADILGNTAEIYLRTGNLQLANQFAIKALAIRQNLKDVIGIADSHVQLSKIYLAQNNIKTAEKHADSSLNIALNNRLLIQKKEAAEHLYKIYKQQKEWKKALQIHEIYMQAKDSLYNDETKNAATEHAYKFEYEKKHYTDSIANQTQLELADSKQKAKTKQRNIAAVAFFVSILLLMIIFVILRKQRKANRFLDEKNNQLNQANKKLDNSANQQNILNQKLFAQSLEIDQRNIELNQQKEELKAINEQVLEQKQEIEKAHTEITASINYAKNIQHSLLTKPEIISSYLSEYFLMFLPRDNVSGDFYYFNKVGEHLVIAIADCTGHGVPGGFLTMLGITNIHEIVKRKEADSAGKVLELLRERFKEIFITFGDDKKNGLDIAFCVINTKTHLLQYAGAYNPLYLIRNNEPTIYKATRNPIGFYPKEKPFETTKIKLQKNDTIYLYSDGFQDQFNEKNQKFGTKKFKQLLLDIHQKPMKEQKTILEQTLANWMGNHKQTDDINLFGMRYLI